MQGGFKHCMQRPNVLLGPSYNDLIRKGGMLMRPSCGKLALGVRMRHQSKCQKTKIKKLIQIYFPV